MYLISDILKLTKHGGRVQPATLTAHEGERAIGRGVGNPGLLFVSSQVGSVASRLFGGRLADRRGHRAVLVPSMIGAAVTLAATSVVAGLPSFLLLAAASGVFYGVSVVVLLSVAAEAAPPEERSAAINTYGLGSDLAQLLAPWGLGLAAGMWDLRGALVVAGAVPLVGAAVVAFMSRSFGKIVSALINWAVVAILPRKLLPRRAKGSQGYLHEKR